MTESGRMLAAIMFTDIVGYTALMQEDESNAKVLRDRHRYVMENYIPEYNGKIVQYYGDGTLSVFKSAIESVNCSIEIQLAFQDVPQIPLRIGIHVGDIVFEDNGAYGDGVNVASRIESLSAPKGILISDKVFYEIKNHPSIKYESLGKFELKNVDRAYEVFAIANDHLSIPSPQQLKKSSKESVKSIAVLPFVNVGSQPENEYFSDGITDELINTLSKIDGLAVTSRTSSFRFKGENKDIREIGSQLNVSSILEGSVRMAGDKVRINAQLINAADGYQVWADVYNRRLEDIFDVQDEISRKIANQLKERLTGKESKEKLVASQTENLEAYNSYLKGLHYVNKWTPNDIRNAMEFFDEAIRLETNYASAYAGIANCYNFLGSRGQVLAKLAYPKAKEAAEKALEINPNLVEAHLQLSVVRMHYDWDWKGAISCLEKSLELNPGSSTVHYSLYNYYATIGEFEKAKKEIVEALKLDPLSLRINTSMGDSFFYLRMYEEAIKQYEKTLELDSSFRSAIGNMAWVYVAEGEYEKAEELFIHRKNLINHPLKGLMGLGFVYAKMNKSDKARDCLEKILKRVEEEDNILLDIDLAILYTSLGDYDKTFLHLERAVNEKYGIIYLKTHYGFTEIRNDDRFINLLQKIGLAS